MQRLLIGLLLLPCMGRAQKVTKDIQPDNHQVWLATDDLDLNFRIIQSGAVFTHFRTEGPVIFMYISGAGQLSPRDYAYFITDQDTVVIHSTGTQPGGWNGNNPYHEYQMTKEELVYLSVHPVRELVVSHYGGWQVTNMPAKDQNRLMPYCSAILKDMQ